MAWSAPTEWERWDPDKLIQCPFDEVHRIPAKRYQYHIIKCREQHPEKDFVACPFNAKHIMLRNELRQHITRCTDKGEIEPYSKGNERDSEGFYFKGDTSVPCYRREELSIPPDDDWDRDDDEITTQQNLCEYYKTKQFSTSYQIFGNNQPVTNNQSVQDILSLQPDDRERFKNNMRVNAVQKYTCGVNNGNHRNYCHDSYSNNPAFHANTQYNHLRYSPTNRVDNETSSSDHGDSRQSRANLSMKGLSPESLSRHMPGEGHTFRGAGRARLAEEARRTQFGISSSAGFIGRGRAMFNAQR